jgi:hypothetical protein
MLPYLQEGIRGIFLTNTRVLCITHQAQLGVHPP